MDLFETDFSTGYDWVHAKLERQAREKIEDDNYLMGLGIVIIDDMPF